jgi:hypothetical protein
MHIGQAEVSTRMFVGKFLVIQTQLVQDGGMQVVEMNFVLDGIITIIIGGTVTDAGFNAPTRKPHCKAMRIMIPAIATLGCGSPAEFTTPPNESVFQKATLF